jgi:hypothetical protein
MRKYLLPFFLIIAGICLVILSVRSTKTTVELTEVSGSISNHSSSQQKIYHNRPHYFWLRGYQCTFIIPTFSSSDLDPSVFDRSFQDTSHVYVKIPADRRSDLQIMGKVIPVQGLRSDSNVYLEESDAANTTFRFKAAFMIPGMCLVLASLIILILYLVKEVRSY